MKDTTRYERLQVVFERARDLSGSARISFLEAACTGDPDLRREVDALLVADAGAGDAFAEERMARERSAIDRAFDGLGVAGSKQDPGTGTVEPQEHSASGTRVRHYRILRKIGEGGMGEVFVAFDEVLKRKVALKTIRDKKTLRRGTLERLRLEARTLSKLDHPRVCRIFDYLEGAERDYLVLEYVEGRTVADALASGLTRPAAWRIAEQTTEALVAAHAAGIVHRDLKPANLMVTPEGDVKVLDFGLARLEDVDETTLTAEIESASKILPPPPSSSVRMTWGLGTHTQAGALLGTPLYMSPEQARGEVVGTPSDLYSLGLVLHELFTGQGVYPRALPLQELLDRVRQGVTQPAPGLSRDLLRFFGSVLDPSAFNRPTAAEVLERLRSIRAKPARRWRLVGIAALGLAAVGAWTKYTVDLRHREQQAENLIDYLVDDLRQQLVPLGKLDLLAGLGHKALEYFQAVPESDWTESELEHRCKAFYQLGEVLLQQGDSSGAREFFEAALSYARDMTRRRPKSPEWIFQRGQCEFYVGHVAYELGDYERARPWLEAYLATARELRQLDPDSSIYLMEELYAQTNLGALAERNLRHEDAAGIFEKVVAGWRTMLAGDPDDPGYLLELADALSWMARSLDGCLEAERAIATKSEEVEVWDSLVASDPQSFELRFSRTTALYKLAGLKKNRHPDPEDEDLWTGVLEVARGLVRADPSNVDYLTIACLAETGYAGYLMDQGRLASVSELLDQALQRSLGLCELDPTNLDWEANRAWVEVQRGRLELLGGDPHKALEILDEVLSQELVDPLSNRSARFWRALALSRLDRRQEARGDLQILVQGFDAGWDAPTRFIVAGALRQLGRTDEAESIRDDLRSHGYFLEKTGEWPGSPASNDVKEQ